jgi:hypothetical protein
VAAERAGLSGVTFHGLRHSFVAILVAAGCNVREVSEWAGHNNVAFTLTRYGGLFEDGSDEAVSRLDALLRGSAPRQHRAAQPAAFLLRFRSSLGSAGPGRPSARVRRRLASARIVQAGAAGFGYMAAALLSGLLSTTPVKSSRKL